MTGFARLSGPTRSPAAVSTVPGRGTGRRSVIRSVLAALLAGIGLVPNGAAETEAAPNRTVPASAQEITLSFAPVVKRAAPAVVNIFTRKTVERPAHPLAGDRFFEHFFGDVFPSPFTRRRMESSLGSGVIVDPSGIVVSNHHVVDGAEAIVVALSDRREFDAEVIFTDPKFDLVVLRLIGAPDTLPALMIRESGRLEVGDLVLAIGNPFGVGQTVTSGIISGLSRGGLGSEAGNGLFIQTDAAINPGNSGGALVDMTGQLVGVNTAILSRSGGSDGIGFAIPASLVANTVRLVRLGFTEPVHPWLGMDGQPVDRALADALGMDRPRGLVINDLHPRSPLASAGLRRGDVIVTMDSVDVDSMQELDFLSSTRPIGTDLDVTVFRDGRYWSGRFRLAPAPDDGPASDEIVLGRQDPLPGLRAVTINPAVIDRFDLPLRASGVLVLSANGPAARVGLRPGDFIRRVNGREIADAAMLVRALHRARGRVELTIWRRGSTWTIRYRS